MPLFEKKDSFVTCKEKFLCILACITEKELKPKKEPNLTRIVNRVPYANPYNQYKQSGKKPKTGTIQQFGDGKDQRNVVVVYSHYYSGSNCLPTDLSSKRKEWFKEALAQLACIPGLMSVAFDQGNIVVDVGCNYNEYKQMLSDFEATYELNNGSPVTVVIYNDPETIQLFTDDNLARKRPAPTYTKKVVEPVAVIPAKTVIIKKKPVDPIGLDLSRVVKRETIYTLDDFCTIASGEKKKLIELPMSPSWRSLFADSSLRTELEKVQQKLGDIIHEDDTFPVADEIFNCMNYCNFDELSAVVLGADPYPTRGNAHGLSFSVKMGTAVPRSLINIYSALEHDPAVNPPFVRPKHGCLNDWAKQGVLLLNSALTVKEGKAGSHAAIWAPFTDKLIQLISQKTKNVVFILWGNDAKAKKKLINAANHCILEFNHPSPMIPGNTFGTACKNFSEANSYLIKVGKKPIDWSLS